MQFKLSEFNSYISDLNALSIMIRLLMAIICGGVIGLERGIRGQAAGCRTHMLVCIGSALVMMTNIFAVNSYGGGTDPTRLGAQVVSGIGFLGAGTILITSKHQIKGLTTAAGLWASACMGLAIGIGFYELAIIGNIFIFLVIGILNRFDSIIYGQSKVMEIYVELSGPEVLQNIIAYARENSYEIKHIQVVKNKAIDSLVTGTIFTLKTKEKCDHSDIIAEISQIKGLSYIEEL